jgi:hypothetical protein
MKAYWSGGMAPRILNLGTRRRWEVSFTSRPLYPRERVHGTHWIEGYVGPIAGLDAVGENIPALAGNQTPVIQPIA